MTTWLEETRYEDPNKKPEEIEFDPETGKEIKKVLEKIEEIKSNKKD